MNVEYTGRQCEVTENIRKQVQLGLSKLCRILGDGFETHVIVSAEKYRCIAEITVSVRGQALVGLAEATEMGAAVGEALDRIERQALKYKTRVVSKKRQARKKWKAEAPAEQLRMAVGASVTTAVPVLVHTYPSVTRSTEAHVTQSQDSVALRAMTVEEAIKEAEFRDRDVFVFRDPQGKVKVLHRTRDGKLELIEAP